MSRVVKSISSCRDSLRASTKALHPLASPSSTIGLPPILPGLPESLAQLLSRLHHDITSLALSFKPPITEAAATAQLDKVHEGYGRIAACVVAASGGTKCDSFLVEEWREGVESIGTELERLLDVLEKAATTSGSSSTSKSDSENPYLLYTGLVWEAIGRLSSDLSTSEIQSVGKKWRSQGEVLKDAWTEYKEFLEEQDEDDEDEGDQAGFDDDDEFGELQDMLSGGKKMSEEERARAEAAKNLLGLHQILLATLPRYLPLLALEPDEAYRPILDACGAMVGTFDSVVSSMYPPQQADEIGEGIQDLRAKSLKLLETIRERVKRNSATDKHETCLTFLNKWESKMESETKAWDAQDADELQARISRIRL